jgi:hypothetical protein
VKVEIGQRVLAPHPEDGMVLATVIAHGEPSDAIEVLIKGRRRLRKVAILLYHEGDWKGRHRPCAYDLLRPVEERA